MRKITDSALVYGAGSVIFLHGGEKSRLARI